MENKMMRIGCEKDLEIYEKHLKEMEDINAHHKGLLTKHLIGCIGKWVMVETCAGKCYAKKVGKLLEVGDDYIVLKMGDNCVSTLIPLANINFITIAHRYSKKMIMG